MIEYGNKDAEVIDYGVFDEDGNALSDEEKKNLTEEQKKELQYDFHPHKVCLD